MTANAKQKSVKQVEPVVTCSNENASVVVEGSGSAPKVQRGAEPRRRRSSRSRR